MDYFSSQWEGSTREVSIQIPDLPNNFNQVIYINGQSSGVQVYSEDFDVSPYRTIDITLEVPEFINFAYLYLWTEYDYYYGDETDTPQFFGIIDFEPDQTNYTLTKWISYNEQYDNNRLIIYSEKDTITLQTNSPQTAYINPENGQLWSFSFSKQDSVDYQLSILESVGTFQISYGYSSPNSEPDTYIELTEDIGIHQLESSPDDTLWIIIYKPYFSERESAAMVTFQLEEIVPY